MGNGADGTGGEDVPSRTGDNVKFVADIVVVGVAVEEVVEEEQEEEEEEGDDATGGVSGGVVSIRLSNKCSSMERCRLES